MLQSLAISCYSYALGVQMNQYLATHTTDLIHQVKNQLKEQTIYDLKALSNAKACLENVDMQEVQLPGCCRGRLAVKAKQNHGKCQ